MTARTTDDARRKPVNEMGDVELLRALHNVMVRSRDLWQELGRRPHMRKDLVTRKNGKWEFTE